MKVYAWKFHIVYRFIHDRLIKVNRQTGYVSRIYSICDIIAASITERAD